MTTATVVNNSSQPVPGINPGIQANSQSSIPWKKVMIVGLCALGLLCPIFLLPAINMGRNEQITAFTSYTVDNPERLAMSKMVAGNQRKYCEDHDYEYLVFEENLAAPALPYWSKIQGILKLLKSKDSSEWIVWLDDDAVITNPSIELREFILSHGGDDPATHVIVTQDSMSGQSWCTDVNTGVLIVRNSKFSRKFFKELWKMRKEEIGHYTLGTCPNQICLHEQQAMHLLLRRNRDFREHVRIIPQRDAAGIGMNVFQRFTHFDQGRNQELNYEGDPASTRYREGDFIAQCTGLATVGSPRYETLCGKIFNFVRKYNFLSFMKGWISPTNYRLECVEGLVEDSKAFEQKRSEKAKDPQ